jgi:hypothetical protein
VFDSKSWRLCITPIRGLFSRVSPDQHEALFSYLEQKFQHFMLVVHPFLFKQISIARLLPHALSFAFLPILLGIGMSVQSRKGN